MVAAINVGSVFISAGSAVTIDVKIANIFVESVAEFAVTADASSDSDTIDNVSVSVDSNAVSHVDFSDRGSDVSCKLESRCSFDAFCFLPSTA